MGVDDARQVIDLALRHLRLAKTPDDCGALDRIDATRGRTATRLGLLDESRLSRSALDAVALQRFANDLFRARADLKRESACIAIIAFRRG
jgi:hypothetical protein